MLLAAGCSGPSISPEEPDGNGNIEEYLESNIIYNGNLSLYSYNRWPSYEPVNNRRRSEIIRHIGLLGGIGSREAIWNSYGSIEPISYGESFDFQYNDKVFNELSAAGLRYCLQMKVDALVVNPDDYGPRVICLETVDPETGKRGKTGEFIHGNNNPSSLGKYASLGCVRMDNTVIKYIASMLKPGDIVVMKREK